MRASILLIFVFSVFATSCDFILQKHPEPELIVADSNYSPVIRIITPEAGVVLRPGDICDITWDTLASFRLARIELYKKSAFQFVIVSSVRNQGVYRWQIPGNFTNSVHYKIRISDYDNSEFFGISEMFAILYKN